MTKEEIEKLPEALKFIKSLCEETMCYECPLWAIKEESTEEYWGSFND